MSEPKNSHWSLFHRESKIQIDALSYSQVALLVSTFETTQISKWYAWHEGLPGWQRLEAFLELLNLKSNQLYRSVPAPPKDLPVEESAEVVDVARPNAGDGIDNRMAKRFQKKWKVYFQVSGRSLESETVDISISGFQIKDILPLDVGGTISAVFVKEDGTTLDLICQLLPGDARNRFTISRVARLDLLQQWLTRG